MVFVKTRDALSCLFSEQALHRDCACFDDRHVLPSRARGSSDFQRDEARPNDDHVLCTSEREAQVSGVMERAQIPDPFEVAAGGCRIPSAARTPARLAPTIR